MQNRNRRQATRTAGRRRPAPRRPAPPRRKTQLASVLNAMTRMSIARPTPPRAPKNARARRNPQVSTRSDTITITGQEILTIASVPVASVVGDLIYVLEVNPSQFSRLAVFASQYKQWKGDLKMKVESLGNAFANSSVSCAFVADPDQSELPSNGIALVQVADSAPTGCRAQLHLQSTNSATVDAPWKFGAQNWKYCQDTDVSDRASGLFLVVSNGPPGGTAPIPLKITANYRVQFQGNTYLAMEPAAPTALTAVYGVNNGVSDFLFPGTTGWTAAGAVLTLNYPAGTVGTKYQGLWQLGGTLIQMLAASQGSTTGTFRYINQLNSMNVTNVSTTYTFGSALPALVAATAYTFIVLPRSSSQN